MAPPPAALLPRAAAAAPPSPPPTKAAKPAKSDMSQMGLIVEAWAEGLMVGSLVILMLIVVCNLRRHVLLHKLILIEQFLALWHGTFIFFDEPVYGWYLSSTVVPLYISYFMHNVISWLKIRPFLSRRNSMIYIISLCIVQPYWGVALWTNYENFNALGNNHYKTVRPWEALFRDPWWIFTTCYLIHVIRRDYNCSVSDLMRASPRFAVLSFCMFASVVFVIVDAVVTAAQLNSQDGINPYWRLGLIFKCASDTIFLDDFKSVLNSLVSAAMDRAGGAVHSGAMGSRRRSSAARGNLSGRDRFGSVTDHQMNSIAATKRNSSDGDSTVVLAPGPSETPPTAHHGRWGSKLLHSRATEAPAVDPQIKRSTSITMSSVRPEDLPEKFEPTMQGVTTNVSATGRNGRQTPQADGTRLS